MYISSVLFTVLPLFGPVLAYPLDSSDEGGRVTSPEIAETGISLRSPLLLERTELLPRADCDNIHTIIDAIGTSSALAIYATTGGMTAHFICQLYTDGRRCTTIGNLVTAWFATLFILLKQTGAISSRDLPSLESLADFLSREFAEDGATFDSITTVTPHLLPRYASDQRTPVEVVRVEGLSTLDNSTKFNMDIYDFGGGEGHIWLPHDALVDRRASKTVLEARSPGPGFKLSYTARLPTKLSKSHQHDMAEQFAVWWTTSADCCDLHDLMGFVETGNVANFYYRLIPERSDFGLNYESVDVCGKMGGFL